MLLEESLRKVDIAVRYGGEEFVLILPATPKIGAEVVADRAMYLAKAKGKNQVELYANDRRSFSRIRAMLNGEFREMSLQAHPLETVDVSGGGLRFSSARSIPLGSLVDVDLLMSENGKSLRLAGRVVDSRESDSGKFEVAVRVVEIDADDRRQLGVYLRQIEPASAEPSAN